MLRLVETTQLTRYPWTKEITFGQGSEFIGSEIRNSLIETEYGKKLNPTSSRNLQANTIIEIIH